MSASGSILGRLPELVVVVQIDTTQKCLETRVNHGLLLFPDQFSRTLLK